MNDDMKDDEATKVCSHKNCKQEKPMSDFPRNKSSKDGYSHWCKTCHSSHRTTTKRSMSKAVGGAQGAAAQDAEKAI